MLTQFLFKSDWQFYVVPVAGFLSTMVVLVLGKLSARKHGQAAADVPSVSGWMRQMRLSLTADSRLVEHVEQTWK